MNKKIILYGGTFDPIHLGHSTVASFAMDYLKADELIFIPASRSPFKTAMPTPDNHRLNMISSVITKNSGFSLSKCELSGKLSGFTIDTVNYFREKLGTNTKFFWLIGADMVADLAKWHKISELINLCQICVMNRGGFDNPDFNQLKAEMGGSFVEKIKANIIQTPFINISGTKIRSIAQQGDDISALVSPEVAEYITRNSLYR